jgi:tRNA threonylcarbamoyladenosine biosynthesis protein TsaB
MCHESQTMRLLTIDTACRIGTVAVMDGSSVISSFDSMEQTRHGERLLDLVARALEQASCSLSDLDLIAAGMGPGSFTGVRVGMATAKGLALAVSRPLVGVVSLEAMAHAARSIVGERPVVAMLDAKKGEVFLGAYGPSGQPLGAPTHLPRDQAAAWMTAIESKGAGPCFVCGEVARELDLASWSVLSHPMCDLPAALAIGAIAQATWASSRVSQLDLLEPLYVRPPDIQAPRGRQ